MKKAIVLLSGGLDSSTTLYWAKKLGYKCTCLIFEYGQRHNKELVSAKKIAKKAGCPFKVVGIRLPWSKSSLLNKKLKLPLNKRMSMKKSSKLPSTYVPGRNTIFLSYALSFAESMRASVIFIGANAVDFSGYPDCKPGYYNAFNKVLKALGTRVQIKVPLIKMSKTGIVRKGAYLGVPFRYTWSCYKGGRRPCGKCDSCRFRAKGFQEAGVFDNGR